MKNCSLDLLKKTILKTQGKIFRVDFIKRKDGSLRKMIARTKLPTGNAAYNADDYDLIHVYDMIKKGWRSIPVDALLYFKCGNTELGEPIE